jgi:N-acetylglucosamine-6-phosphate deacetylase
MPSAVPLTNHVPPQHATGIIKFTNCLLARGKHLVKEDLWISSVTGKILNGQEILYGERAAPDEIIDLGRRILSPGLIDVQLNGAYGFDFSVIPDGDTTAYAKGVAMVNRKLIATGVTSYLPTMTSQRPEVYQKALPFLGPSGGTRDPTLGSESLGAHCEGPFLNPSKNGIHPPSVLQTPSHGLPSLTICYGAPNLPAIKMITLAPELPGALPSIRALASSSPTIVSIGHSAATYEEALEAMHAGATMITHLFNAMAPLHHRNPGIFGLLGTTTSSLPNKPFFGIIADGIHLHPTSVKIAWTAHPEGLVLVTDAMRLAGMPDGVYDWSNGARIVKRGSLLTLEENGRIAGSCSELVECVGNFVEWTGAGVAEALRAVTEVPARLLGLQGVKGCLEEGADADLVVLDFVEGQEGAEVGDSDAPKKKLVVEQVWKFGRRVFVRESDGEAQGKEMQNGVGQA